MGVMEGAKAVVDLARSYDKMDLYKQAVELMAQVTELAAENLQLTQVVAKLKGELEVKDAIVFRENKYYLQRGDALDGPYCTRCYDADRLLVRLQGMPRCVPECPKCKTCHFTHTG